MPLNLFCKTALPDELPLGMKEVIEELKKTSNKEKCLRKAYDFLNQKYRGYRIKTYLRLFEIFAKDVTVLWSKNGFLHCTNINYLLRILLIKSGLFEESDIEIKWTLIWWISPHQYLKIKVGDEKFVNVDIWASAYGIKFGDYAKSFK